jgi:hypothetical protein
LGLSIGFAFLCALGVLGGSNILFFGFSAVKKAFYLRVHRALRYTEKSDVIDKIKFQ